MCRGTFATRAPQPRRARARSDTVSVRRRHFGATTLSVFGNVIGALLVTTYLGHFIIMATRVRPELRRRGWDAMDDWSPFTISTDRQLRALRDFRSFEGSSTSDVELLRAVYWLGGPTLLMIGALFT